jgi:hypothetical protein
MRYRITTPVKGASDIVAGVSFVDGVGHTSTESVLPYFRRHGYRVEEAPEPAPEEPPEAPEPAPEEPPAPFVPNRGSSKADWLAFVTGPNAGDKALSEADATAMTRDQLAEHVLGPKEGEGQ